MKEGKRDEKNNDFPILTIIASIPFYLVFIGLLFKILTFLSKFLNYNLISDNNNQFATFCVVLWLILIYYLYRQNEIRESNNLLRKSDELIKKKVII